MKAYRNWPNFSLVPNNFADGLGLTVFISESGQYTVSDIENDPDYQIFSEGVTRSGMGGEFLIESNKVMKEDLKNSYIYRFDGVPHSAFDNATPCVLPMVFQFLNNPSEAPDHSCMSSFKQVYRVE